jgi:hypothetical protein
VWLIGATLYGLIITAICFRLTLLRLSPADLTPQYGINMGAMSTSIGLLECVGHAFFWVALGAWALTCITLLGARRQTSPE